MNILHIIEIRGIGGAEKLLLDFIPIQVKTADVKCVILYNKKHKTDAVMIGELLASNNVSIKYLEFKNLLLLFLNIIAIKKLIKIFLPDIIHTHLRIAQLLIYILKKINLNTIVISTVHGFSDNNQFNWARKYANKKILKNFDGLIFVSNFIYLYYLNNGLIHKNILFKIVPNGYLLQQKNYLIEIKSAEKNYLNIILPGRLTELKGHKYAIECIEILKSKKINVRLDIYGLGPHEKKISELIHKLKLENIIHLKGFSNDILTLMKNYDVVLVPSLIESFGMVFLDAFSSNVPVVAFDLPAGNEMIKHGYNGRLAIPYSSESLVEEIEFLIKNKGKKEEIIFNAKKDLIENYNVEKMVTSYMEFYQQVLNITNSID